ncbi:MAG: GHKL domain-containing protein [Candidatus Nitronauta litoralis]|uniref:histidine kinase n=1 Tax=Candidatus Nitronauta litoralis TaxID=2705533 RepID=A0A7T0FZE2_9BACT|nr:MAG: GHKL domain-containing protein [Candidatus Nitronauta litoralis]
MKSPEQIDAHLHWFHWVIVSLSIILTMLAWWFTKTQVDEKIEGKFRRESQQAIELISERMQKYEDALWAGVSAIQAKGGDISAAEWRVFEQSFGVEVKYPGVLGLGVIFYVPQHKLKGFLEKQRMERPDFHIHPPHDEKEFFPITYIEPVENNSKAVGLDMVHETNRYTAAKKARDTGEAQITGPIVLVQDEKRTPGFLFFTPFYAGGKYESLEERRKNFIGMVYAPFIAEVLMNGVLMKEELHVGFRLRDGKETLYDQFGENQKEYDQNPLFKKTISIDWYGRKWEFDIQTTQSFKKATDSFQPLTILIGGIIIDALIIFLILALSRTNKRAIDFANSINKKLIDQAVFLKKSNEDLEQFAYVVSHDLKAPLRAINNLSDWIAEDLGENLESETKENIVTLKNRVARMENLIQGILNYSRAGTAGSEKMYCNIEEIVSNALSLMEGYTNISIDIGKNIPNVFADPTQLTQVFVNLISNAIRHSDAPGGKIKVSAKQYQKDERYIEILVANEGKKIPQEYADRIFKMFQTLEARDEKESTGVGLTIVKKIVENHSGRVCLLDTADLLTTFQVLWPKCFQLEAPLAGH